ncbi:hypothetical protein H4219_003480 [Mycoemilia scoparia]|uniref:Uncharacterized protein n=1 Tax=Mycoemilia scoparia TaxID=417184 RepID=A0A9W7ZUM2_9FUNG|nr:hypothetical protein H4219_003480 [Mycoemilia scoparia]
MENTDDNSSKEETKAQTLHRRRSNRLRTPAKKLQGQTQITPAKETAKRNRGRGRGRGRGRPRGRGRGGKAQASNHADQNEEEAEDESKQTADDNEEEGKQADDDIDEDEFPDAAQLSSEGEDYMPEKPIEINTPTTGRRGRPPGSRNKTTITRKRMSAPIDSLVETPAKKFRQSSYNRIPVHVSKHDPFSLENLDKVVNIMKSSPITTSEHDERLETMKMSEALKICSNENMENVPDGDAISEVYMLLAWAVLNTKPNDSQNNTSNPPPTLSDAAKSIVLQIFSAMGHQVREETTDMAGSCRRHAARRILYKIHQQQDASTNKGEGEVSHNLEQFADSVEDRRNPLGISNYVTDVYRQFPTSTGRTPKPKP